ncbi:hypothetical protein [Pseudomonas phage vB_Pae_CF55b]|nr:hypothetical protein [Pseudomonas phage vB_Pae_CF55b]
MSLITTTNAVTMSSREIAELTGKRHDNVIADIRKMLLELGYQIDADGRSPDFSGDVPDAYGRLQHCFNLPRREVEILLTGYSIPLRAKCLDRLHELEARAKQTLPALPGDYIQALEHLLESKRSEQKAIEERDHAIATKAEIGSRREATAMASASAAVREARRLADELGRGTRQATVKAVENLTKTQFDPQAWRKLRAWCDSHGVQPKLCRRPSLWPCPGVACGCLEGGVRHRPGRTVRLSPTPDHRRGCKFGMPLTHQ